MSDMWIQSQVASTTLLQVYTDFNEQIYKDKDETVHIDFINRIYKTNNENGTFQILGIDMYDYYRHCSTSYFQVSEADLYIMIVNQANILIKNLFGDSENLTNLTTLGVYMIFQRYDNNEVQLNISKIQFYDLIIIVNN